MASRNEIPLASPPHPTTLSPAQFTTRTASSHSDTFRFTPNVYKNLCHEIIKESSRSFRSYTPSFEDDHSPSNPDTIIKNFTPPVHPLLQTLALRELNRRSLSNNNSKPDQISIIATVDDVAVLEEQCYKEWLSKHSLPVLSSVNDLLGSPKSIHFPLDKVEKFSIPSYEERSHLYLKENKPKIKKDSYEVDKLHSYAEDYVPLQDERKEAYLKLILSLSDKDNSSPNIPLTSQNDSQKSKINSVAIKTVSTNKRRLLNGCVPPPNSPCVTPSIITYENKDQLHNYTESVNKTSLNEEVWVLSPLSYNHEMQCYEIRIFYNDKIRIKRFSVYRHGLNNAYKLAHRYHTLYSQHYLIRKELLEELPCNIGFRSSHKICKSKCDNHCGNAEACSEAGETWIEELSESSDFIETTNCDLQKNSTAFKEIENLSMNNGMLNNESVAIIDNETNFSINQDPALDLNGLYKHEISYTEKLDLPNLSLPRNFSIKNILLPRCSSLLKKIAFKEWWNTMKNNSFVNQKPSPWHPSVLFLAEPNSSVIRANEKAAEMAKMNRFKPQKNQTSQKPNSSSPVNYSVNNSSLSNYDGSIGHENEQKEDAAQMEPDQPTQKQQLGLPTNVSQNKKHLGILDSFDVEFEGWMGTSEGYNKLLHITPTSTHVELTNLEKKVIKDDLIKSTRHTRTTSAPQNLLQPLEFPYKTKQSNRNPTNRFSDTHKQENKISSLVLSNRSEFEEGALRFAIINYPGFIDISKTINSDGIEFTALFDNEEHRNYAQNSIQQHLPPIDRSILNDDNSRKKLKNLFSHYLEPRYDYKGQNPRSALITINSCPELYIKLCTISSMEERYQVFIDYLIYKQDPDNFNQDFGLPFKNLTLYLQKLYSELFVAYTPINIPESLTLQRMNKETLIIHNNEIETFLPDGVSFDRSNTAWRCFWKEGYQNHSKGYSSRRYGYNQAKLLAVEARLLSELQYLQPPSRGKRCSAVECLLSGFILSPRSLSDFEECIIGKDLSSATKTDFYVTLDEFHVLPTSSNLQTIADKGQKDHINTFTHDSDSLRKEFSNSPQQTAGQEYNEPLEESPISKTLPNSRQNVPANTLEPCELKLLPPTTDSQNIVANELSCFDGSIVANVKALPHIDDPANPEPNRQPNGNAPEIFDILPKSNDELSSCVSQGNDIAATSHKQEPIMIKTATSPASSDIKHLNKFKDHKITKRRSKKRRKLPSKSTQPQKTDIITLPNSSLSKRLKTRKLYPIIPPSTLNLRGREIKRQLVPNNDISPIITESPTHSLPTTANSNATFIPTTQPNSPDSHRTESSLEHLNYEISKDNPDSSLNISESNLVIPKSPSDLNSELSSGSPTYKDLKDINDDLEKLYNCLQWHSTEHRWSIILQGNLKNVWPYNLIGNKKFFTASSTSLQSKKLAYQEALQWMEQLLACRNDQLKPLRIKGENKFSEISEANITSQKSSYIVTRSGSRPTIKLENSDAIDIVKEKLKQKRIKNETPAENQTHLTTKITLQSSRTQKRQKIQRDLNSNQTFNEGVEPLDNTLPKLSIEVRALQNNSIKSISEKKERQRNKKTTKKQVNTNETEIPMEKTDTSDNKAQFNKVKTMPEVISNGFKPGTRRKRLTEDSLETTQESNCLGKDLETSELYNGRTRRKSYKIVEAITTTNLSVKNEKEYKLKKPRRLNKTTSKTSILHT